MNETKLKKLEDAVTEIAYRYEQTRQSHERLKEELTGLQTERDQLLEHNRLASEKIESMITRLKSMEQPHV